MSNGSERIAEYPGRPDYTALIEGARSRTEAMVKPNLVDDLADAVEALVQENAALRKTITHTSETMMRGEHYSGLVAERDALQEHIGRKDRQIQGWIKSATEAKDVHRAEVSALREQLAAAEADRDSYKRLWERLDTTSEKHYENLIQDRFDAVGEAKAEAWDEGHSHCFRVEKPGAGGNPYRSEGGDRG